MATPPRTGEPKGEKRVRTRARLLAAARELVAERGYEHTTLADVAKRAGMTTGAIYGNFANREALFVALGQEFWTPIAPSVVAPATDRGVLRAIAEATLAALPERAIAAVGRLRGLAYALENPDVQVQVAAVTGDDFAAGVAWLERVVDAAGFRMPPARLLPILVALSDGLTFQRLLTPELYPDELFYAAFDALAWETPLEGSL
jgi:AcrR family transcriptional regulator